MPSRTVWTILIGAGALGALVMLHGNRHRLNVGAGIAADRRIDPQFGAHRGLGASDSEGPSWRYPTSQDPAGGLADWTEYPHSRSARHPSSPSEHRWAGKAMAPVGYSPLDYGETPGRIIGLWKDKLRDWEGFRARGATQQEYHLHLFHLRPSYPTRGIRSAGFGTIGAIQSADQVRIPAVFVPSAVG